MSAPNDIIFWHYAGSPYARKIRLYLILRQIPYAQCIQPSAPPREDLDALGVKYRRIPLLSIGRDMYCDTRLILKVLDKRFPPSAQHPGLSSPEAAGAAALLVKFTTDSGVFMRATQLIPPEAPIFKDEKFLRDRETLLNRSWRAEDVKRGRPEALAYMRDAFDVLENVLSDGREWIGGTKNVDTADVDGVWPFVWVLGFGLPSELFSKNIYPKTYAWIARFNEAVEKAEASAPKVVTLKGPDAVASVKAAKFWDSDTDVDKIDPLGLSPAENVEVWPVDYGFSHKDVGPLVKLTKEEVAVSVKSKDGDVEVRVHAPRWGFRVRPVGGSPKA